MKKIVYYVASSLDGFIAGPNDDISHFVFQGPGVDQYRADLNAFRTTIMGRRTYEFGYQYGLQPGQPAYPHMQHHIFSKTLKFDNPHEQVHPEPLSIERVQAIKAQADTDIYLCGGGAFAGWLLDHGLVDQLKLKLNPVLLGAGVPLFGDSKTAIKWKCTESKQYEDGIQIMSFDPIK
ncbi:MAG: dihydrofolate reductase family protein [Bacteroidota bacterium]